MGIETLFSVGASLVGSALQSDATSDAAEAQAESTREGIAEQRRQFDLTRTDFAPYRETGVNALRQFAAGINAPTTAADVMSDPGYKFGLDQGQQAIDRKIAAMGGRVSGAAIKAAGRFGTNYATTGYTAADQRRNDRLNRLASLAGIGQSATGASAAAGTSAANNISSMTTAQGNASAGARMSQGQLWGDTANQISALYQRNRQPSASGWSGYGLGNPNQSGDY